MSDEQKSQQNQVPVTENERQPVFLLPLSVAILGGLMIAIFLGQSFVLNQDAAQKFFEWFAFIPYRLVVSDQVEGAGCR